MKQQIIMALLNGILLGGVYALLGFGMNLIFGVVKVIHMAYGQFVMLGLYLIYTFCVLLHMPLVPACIAGIVAMGILGLITQKLMLNKLITAPRLNQLLALAGLIMILENFCMFSWGADYRAIRVFLPVMQFGEIFLRTSFLIAFFGALITLGILLVLLNKTYVGLGIRASAQDPEMARLVGMNPRFVFYVTLAIGSALTGVVASFFVPIYAVHPQFGATFTVTAFIIVVLGGMGNLLGGFISAFIIGIVTSVAAVLSSAEAAEIIVLILFIVIMIFRPQGLLGEVV